jgi:cyclopropane-fatty-acyl-phospholipid synthase
MLNLLDVGIAAMERGVVPDSLIRLGIQRLCRLRADAFAKLSQSARNLELAKFVSMMNDSPIAPFSDKANEQHYELPAEFFSLVLGPHRKYSCCYWPTEKANLAEAESAALAITCEHAHLEDGQDVLELGCGWGSLSLWMAECYPQSQITAVSNSTSQRRFIEGEARMRELTNLKVITADMNEFAKIGTAARSSSYDRVVSVEMFEHMRNYDQIFERIATWLRPSGKCLIHIFCHRQMAYVFETDGAVNWMGRYFFFGGIMPSRDLPRQFNRHLEVTSQWDWNGRHYQRTSEAWLENLDAHRSKILPILQATYGKANAGRWLHRWRVFFLAVAELFETGAGDEWFVSHYLMENAH